MGIAQRQVVDQVLDDVRGGDHAVVDHLFALAYDELRRMARVQLWNDPAKATLQPAELVHEAFLKLVSSRSRTWESSRHFFGAAVRAMRQILVERARARQASKREWGVRTNLDEAPLDGQNPEGLLALNLALDKLASRNPRHADVTRSRYLLGLTVEETAKLLRIAPRTVNDDWALARAWLQQEVKRSRLPR